MMNLCAEYQNEGTSGTAFPVMYIPYEKKGRIMMGYSTQRQVRELLQIGRRLKGADTAE
jgi:hypothetical protein